MKRNKRVSVRLTEKEFDRLNTMVAKTPYNRETFLRLLLEGYTVQEVPKDYFQFRRQVVSIAYNLDQICRRDLLSWQEQEKLHSLVKEARELVHALTEVYQGYYKEKENKNEHS